MLTAFALGGGSALPPLLDEHTAASWALTQSSSLGMLQTATSLPHHQVLLPARDKTVHVFGAEAMVPFVESVDSTPGLTYRDKLMAAPAGPFLIVNVGTDHRSYAVYADGLNTVGLLDTKHQGAAYLLSYTDDFEHVVGGLLSAHPLRFLLYRFARGGKPYFVQAEAVCSKWRRWSSQGHLLAFNALDRRLFS